MGPHLATVRKGVRHRVAQSTEGSFAHAEMTFVKEAHSNDRCPSSFECRFYAAGLTRISGTIHLGVQGEVIAET